MAEQNTIIYLVVGFAEDGERVIDDIYDNEYDAVRQHERLRDRGYFVWVEEHKTEFCRLVR